MRLNTRVAVAAVFSLAPVVAHASFSTFFHRLPMAGERRKSG